MDFAPQIQCPQALTTPAESGSAPSQQGASQTGCTMAAPCPLLGDGITDDTLVHIGRFLPTAKDLVCLQLTCPRFAAKIIAANCGGVGGTAPAPEMLSIIEEAARLWVAGCSEQERDWVPRRELESWLGLIQEVGLLRVPLVFGRAHADVTLSEGGAVATSGEPAGAIVFRSAASTVVMRSGRHFAQFTVVEGWGMFFGMIRPGWDVERGILRRMWAATASTSRPTGAATPPPTTGRGSRAPRSRAIASACRSTSTRAA